MVLAYTFTVSSQEKKKKKANAHNLELRTKEKWKFCCKINATQGVRKLMKSVPDICLILI